LTERPAELAPLARLLPAQLVHLFAVFLYGRFLFVRTRGCVVGRARGIDRGDPVLVFCLELRPLRVVLRLQGRYRRVSLRAETARRHPVSAVVPFPSLALYVAKPHLEEIEVLKGAAIQVESQPRRFFLRRW
jgi:hypothetical protein